MKGALRCGFDVSFSFSSKFECAFERKSFFFLATIPPVWPDALWILHLYSYILYVFIVISSADFLPMFYFDWRIDNNFTVEWIGSRCETAVRRRWRRVSHSHWIHRFLFTELTISINFLFAMAVLISIPITSGIFHFNSWIKTIPTYTHSIQQEANMELNEHKFTAMNCCFSNKSCKIAKEPIYDFSFGFLCCRQYLNIPIFLTTNWVS